MSGGRTMKLFRQTTCMSSVRGPVAERNCRGVAAAELAVCLPVVVMLVVATIEACSALFLKQSLTAAAYEGVRTAIEENATTKNVQAACDQILADRKIQGAKVTIKPSNIDVPRARRFHRRDGQRTVCSEFRRADDVLSGPDAYGHRIDDD